MAKSTTKIPTEAEIREQAEALYNPAYTEALAGLTAAETAYNTQYENTLTDYDRYVQDLLGKTEQNITDSAVKRGMGRSTRTTYEMTEGLAAVNLEAESFRSNAAQQRQDYLASIQAQRQGLSSSYNQNVMAQILNLNQYYEGIRQFNEQQALRERELALMSRRGGGGGGGGGGATLAELYAQWQKEQAATKKPDYYQKPTKNDENIYYNTPKKTTNK